jgi:hypothetical protein
VRTGAPYGDRKGQLGVADSGERAYDVATLRFDTDLLNSANHRPTGNKTSE